ncbi:hypothetical protein [Pedobacter sp. UYP30]|uniref:hypothetical protein n=1 Tax=Pedobacter sp. UYP30 TaxID=1756400 RepID=UPI0033966586
MNHSNDPLLKLYRNVTNKRIDVGSFDNFKKSMAKKDIRQLIYKGMVDGYGNAVKKYIGKDFDAFNNIYDLTNYKPTANFTNLYKKYTQEKKEIEMLNRQLASFTQKTTSSLDESKIIIWEIFILLTAIYLVRYLYYGVKWSKYFKGKLLRFSGTQLKIKYLCSVV